jgi:predicted DNA-binding protein (UPF0278 family)
MDFLNNPDFLRELEMIHRIRFERGLRPNPDSFQNAVIKTCALAFNRISDELDDVDETIDRLYAKYIRKENEDE